MNAALHTDTESQVRVNIPWLEWYDGISEWIDALTQRGRIKELGRYGVERGDIGELNSKLRDILLDHNPHVRDTRY